MTIFLLSSVVLFNTDFDAIYVYFEFEALNIHHHKFHNQFYINFFVLSQWVDGMQLSQVQFLRIDVSKKCSI